MITTPYRAKKPYSVEYANKNGYTITEPYKDLGFDGSALDRPNFKRLGKNH